MFSEVSSKVGADSFKAHIMGMDKILAIPFITFHAIFVLIILAAIIVFAYHTLTKKTWKVLIYRKHNIINFVIPNPFDTEVSVMIYIDGNCSGYHLTCAKQGHDLGVHVVSKRSFPMYEIKIQPKREARMELVYEPDAITVGKEVGFLVKATDNSGREIKTMEAVLRGNSRGWINVMSQKYYKSSNRIFMV